MTDEENGIEISRRISKACLSITCNQYCSMVKQAYFEGLAEGKPKWHDLKKKPKDLPKEDGEYWCKWEDGAYSTEHYFSDNGFGSYVIAWCEIPKFGE